MYEVELDLHIAKLYEELALPPERIHSVRLSRVVILEGVNHLIFNEAMRDRLNLQIDVHAGSAPYIGRGSPFLPTEYANYEPLQEVVLRTYRNSQWYGYVYVTPALVPNLQYDIVLGSHHFTDLDVEWDDQEKRLVSIPPDRFMRFRTIRAPPPKTLLTQSPLQRLL